MRKILGTLIISTIALFSQGVFAAEVSRAIFTTGVENREPVIQVDSISSSSYNSISFFTELNDLDGHSVTHQWRYNDKIMFEKSFNVGGNRWRVWTTKTLLPEWTGTWTVNVLDTDRSVLKSASFEYQ